MQQEPFYNNNNAIMIRSSMASDPPPPSRETLDAMIAAATAQLTVEQTLSAQEDLYGVVRKVPEKEQPGRIPALLQILRARLGAVKIKRGTAFEVAEKLDRSYADRNDFLLKFLRASKYEPEQAAQQIINFFDMKLELFGREKLVKDITLDDLNDDDQSCLNNGNDQVLHTASRHILVCFPGLRRFKALNNELRARYYTLMSMLESNDTQIDGVTIINYAVGSCRDTTNGVGYIEHARLLLSLPIHVAATHHCSDDVAQYILLYGAIGLGSPTQLARFQAHHGSAVDCIYKLATFGIPNGSLPLSTTDHQPMLERHMAWLRTRRIIDSVNRGPHISHPQFVQARLQPTSLQTLGAGPASPNNSTEATKPSTLVAPGSLKPNADDVLFGQEHKAHPGNIKMHQLMDHLQSQYEAADKVGKMKISLIVVFSMKGTGSRFLDYDESTMHWHIVPDTVARNKVAKAIRNRRRYKPVKAESPQDFKAPAPKQVIKPKEQG